MTDQQFSRNLFFVAPFALITFVFFITLVFSYFLSPVFLAIPLLLAYYGCIWGFVFHYQKNLAKSAPVLKAHEFRAGYKGLSRWMLFWTIGYPLVVGLPAFLWMGTRLPGVFIAIGLLFSLVNGPSEEIFWRLYMERAGKDGQVGPRLRLWYSSAVFASWHFIFVVFLLPEQALAPALFMTLSSTFIAGLLWMLVYQKTGRMFPLVTSHAVLNFLVIWPSTATTVLGISPIPM